MKNKIPKEFRCKNESIFIISLVWWFLDEWSSPVWPYNFSHEVRVKIKNDLGMMYYEVELKIEVQSQYLLQCLHFVE